MFLVIGQVFFLRTSASSFRTSVLRARTSVFRVRGSVFRVRTGVFRVKLKINCFCSSTSVSVVGQVLDMF